MVFLQKATDATYSPCAGNATDQWIAYPENITATGFTLVASGSVDTTPVSLCNADGQHNAVKDWYTRAEASWFAISE